MPPTTSLNATGQFFEEQFKEAWQLFRDNKFDEANALSRRLLMEPSIGALHKAGCHLILAHSPDNYLEHARRAVSLYQNLYSTGDPTQPEPTHVQRQSRRTLLHQAQKVLQQAEQDAVDYPDVYDTEEVQKQLDDACAASAEADEKAEAEADNDDGVSAADEPDVEMTEQEPSQGEGGDEQPSITVSGPQANTDEQSFPSLPTPPKSRGRM